MVKTRSTQLSRRLARLLLAAGLLACVWASTAVVLLEADHECSGAECPICQLVLVARASLAFTGKSVASPMVTAFAAAPFAMPRLLAHRVPDADTLVHRKIRLNN